jgi:hypothetical protein
MFAGGRFVLDAGAGMACGIMAVWALLIPIGNRTRKAGQGMLGMGRPFLRSIDTGQLMRVR